MINNPNFPLLSVYYCCHSFHLYIRTHQHFTYTHTHTHTYIHIHNLLLILLFWTNCYLLDQLRIRKMKVFILSLMGFLSSRRSRFLTYIMFLSSKELLLICLARQVTGNTFPQFLFCLKKLLFLHFLKINKFIYLFIYLFMVVLGLRCFVRAFSSCGEWGLLFFFFLN